MANEPATVTMRSPSGKMYEVPRENLMRAASLGWLKVESEAPKEEDWLSSHARIFNEAATGSGDLPSLWESLKKKAQGMFSETPDVQIENWLKNYNRSASAAVSKYGTGDYRRYIASIPMVGPGMAEAEEEGGTKGIARLLGMTAGAGILSKVPGVASRRLENIEGSLRALKTGEPVKDVIRSISDRGAGAVEVERTKAATSAAEKQAAYAKELEEAKKGYQEKVDLVRSKARSEYEASEAERQAKHEAAVEEAKAKHEATMEATKRAYGESVSRSERAKIQASRLETAKRALSDLKDKYSEQLAENLDKAEAAE
jgi:hypothetical protein